MAYHRLEKRRNPEAHRSYMRRYMRLHRMGQSPAMFRQWKGCFGYSYYRDEHGRWHESPRIAYVRDYMREYMEKYREKKGYLAGSDGSRYNARMRKYMKEYLQLFPDRSAL